MARYCRSSGRYPADDGNEWNREELSEAFDYAQDVIDHQFQRREITDIGEATIYPYGEGDAAGIATAYALVYSATYPALRRTAIAV